MIVLKLLLLLLLFSRNLHLMLVISILFDLFRLFLLLPKSWKKLCLFNSSLFLAQIRFLKPSSLVLSHSTESALLQVFNDTLLATDSGDSVILVLLDLTSAFDTVVHNILLS